MITVSFSSMPIKNEGLWVKDTSFYDDGFKTSELVELFSDYGVVGVKKGGSDHAKLYNPVGY